MLSVQEQESQLRFQFLDEAQEHLTRLESGLVGISQRGLERQGWDALLRAAHSLKGGAAMMGLPLLSELAHRLEDNFKVLKASPTKPDGDLERLLLAAVTSLQQAITWGRQGRTSPDSTVIDFASARSAIAPPFDRLQERLGDPQPETEVALVSDEAGENMRELLFASEVEECLERLQAVLSHPEQPCLQAEFKLAAEELGGLGEMLDLPAFTQLCQEIQQQLQAPGESLPAICAAALAHWRRSQALVLSDNLEWLPSAFSFTAATPEPVLERQPASEPTVKPLVEPFEVKPPASPAPPPVPERNLRVSARQLEQLSDLFGELLTERNGLGMQLFGLRRLLEKLQEKVEHLDGFNLRLRTIYDRVGVSAAIGLTSGQSAIAPAPTLVERDNFDLLELDRYSDTQTLAGEILETLWQIQEITSDFDLQLQGAEQTHRELGRTSQQIHANLGQIRLQPLRELTQRFTRSLRELELQSGKQLALVVKGEGTLIERTILETLNEPLLHLLRNACDHGIEPPQTRQARGKSPRGTITISATHWGDRVAIEVSDDGQGIDLAKIRARAAQMGIATAELQRATDQDLIDLIFEPGFSTAERVSDLSGRGVGMDVVRTNLATIGGTITVTTERDRGTCFLLSVPSTLSVLRVLLVESQGFWVAVASNTVKEIVLLSETPILTSGDRQQLLRHERTIPLISLAEQFQFAALSPQPDSDNPPLLEGIALIATLGEDWQAIAVDRYWGEQEVTLRPVEGGFPLPVGFSGGTILGDGRVVPLLDVAALLQPNPRQTTPAEPAAIAPPTPLVMVVDDSTNVRRFLALLLEKSGYSVEQARDGQEAIAKLKAGLPIQAVICDIEMPRLDGFGFLAQARAYRDYQKLPIYMLTSRSGDKHRNLALNLGATGYFTKPFNEQQLLQTLAQQFSLSA